MIKICAQQPQFGEFGRIWKVWVTTNKKIRFKFAQK